MLTFQELICASPFYHAEIIGGWKGKENSISSIEDDPTHLDMPTLLMIQSHHETISRLDEYLSIQNIKGIFIYGKATPYIPNQMLQFIESQNKPVFFLKEEINYNSMKKTIADLRQLKTMGLYHYVYERSTNYWLPFIQENGIIGFLQRLSLFLDQEVFLLDEHFHSHPILEGNGRQNSFKHLAQAYYQQNTTNQEKEVLSMIKDDQHSYIVFPLFSGDQRHGYILLEEQPSMMIDICTDQVIHTIPALLSYFKKEEAVGKAHQSYKENFLYNLLYNNLDSEQLLLKQGKQWGWDFTQQAQLMVLRINQKNETTKLSINTESIMKRIRSLISAQFLQEITFPLQGDIIIIVFHSEPLLPEKRKEVTMALAQSLHKKVQQDLPDFECEIGIGRHYASNMELFRSFYEAKVALELGNYELQYEAVRHFENIGIARLLSNIHHHILHDYYMEVLKELFKDEENSPVYIDTLESFFQNNADINRTAEQLYIHPNTLRKRLKKLETILSIDFNKLDDLLEIYVALKIMKMIK